MSTAIIQQRTQNVAANTSKQVDDGIIVRGPVSHSVALGERSHTCQKRVKENAIFLVSPDIVKKRNFEMMDGLDGENSPSKALKRSCSTLTMVQEALLGNLVAPFVADRATFNSFASTSREVHEVCKLIPAPWPRRRLPLEAVAQSLSFSPCGQLLACCSGESIHIWNRQSGFNKVIHAAAKVTCVSFSPCGKYLASGHRSHTSAEYDFVLRDNIEVSVVRIWDAKTLECIRVLQGDLHGGMFSIAFSPDSRSIAAGGADQLIRIWNVEDGSCQSTLEGHAGWIYCLRFSPDGKYLASAGEDETSVLLWDLKTLQLVDLEGHTESVHCVVFTPDGRYLVSGSDDETIRLWDMHNGFACSVLEGNLCSVWTIACSPDSKTLVSGGRDTEGNQVIRAWNIKQLKPVSTFRGHNEFVTSLAFSPSGRTLASGSFDCSVRTWNLATESAARWNIQAADQGDKGEKSLQ